MHVHVGSSDAVTLAAVQAVLARIPQFSDTVARACGPNGHTREARMTSMDVLLAKAVAASVRARIGGSPRHIGVGIEAGVVPFHWLPSGWADCYVCVVKDGSGRGGVGLSAPVEVPGDVMHFMTFHGGTLREAFERSGRPIDGAISDGSLIATLTPELMPRQARIEQAVTLAFLSFLQQP